MFCLLVCPTPFSPVLILLIFICHNNTIMESENVQVLQAPKEPAVEGFSVLVEPDRPALE